MALWGKTDTANDKPKYLSTADKAATVGVDVAEATTAANIAKGINKPGWVKYTTYTDGQGNTRHKAETLVAFSSITGDNDAIDPDPVITINVKPNNASATLGAEETVTFSVSASTNRDPVPLTYAWEFSEDGGATWENTQPGWATGFDSATMTIPNADVDLGGGAGDLNGYIFRCVVSAAGATPVTSDVAFLTVA